jgi:hypothetical protein
MTDVPLPTVYANCSSVVQMPDDFSRTAARTRPYTRETIQIEESISNGHNRSPGGAQSYAKSAIGGLSNDTEGEVALGWKSNPAKQPMNCITVGTCHRSADRMIATILLSITKTGDHRCG